MKTKKFKKLFLNNKGLSVIELAISSSMILFIFVAISYYMVQNEKNISNVISDSQTNKSYFLLAQSILSNSKGYQFFSAKPDDDSLFEIHEGNFKVKSGQKEAMFNSLNFYLNPKGDLVSASDCQATNCSYNEKIGVVLVPSSFKGLFRVWLLGIEKSDTDPASYSVSSSLEFISALN